MFKNPNKSSIETTVVMIVGAAVGAMTSRAAFGLIHEDKTGLDAAAAKTQKLTKIGKRVVLAGGTGYLAAGLDGKNTAGAFAKGAAIGASVIQVIDGAKDAAADSPKVVALTTGTKTQRTIAKSLGLGCPCESETLMAMPLSRPSRNHRRLNSPALIEEYNNDYQPMLGNPFGDVDPLQAAINAGAMAN